MKHNITQAVILAAGFGTRLRPLTDTMPKVMVPILGKPILEWHIRQFAKNGVKKFFINLHYLPDVITRYFGGGSKFGVQIQYSYEKEILGTAGGLKGFGDSLDEEFFLIFGDVFSLVDYSKMAMAFHALPPEAIGMTRIGKSKVWDADMAALDENKRFVAIYPKPHTEKAPADAYRLRGMCVLRKKILSFVPPNINYDFYKDLLADVVFRGESFYGYECGEYSKGIDTVEKLREAEDDLRRQGMTEPPPFM